MEKTVFFELINGLKIDFKVRILNNICILRRKFTHYGYWHIVSTKVVNG